MLICCASCWHAWGVQVSRSRVNQRGGIHPHAQSPGDGAQFVVVATQQDNAGAIARVGQGRFTTNPVAGPGDQDDAIFQQVSWGLIMHGILGDRFRSASSLYYFCAVMPESAAIAIGEAESIHKIISCQRFPAARKKTESAAQRTQSKDFSPAARYTVQQRQCFTQVKTWNYLLSTAYF
ncbi:Uncharacterised protein [Klebsiella pneumoniae]|uniref:Uncharacterized protein n=1 Tax=Klebsiella pneumoniae TaxID=573 RepID=A0A2X3HLB6_KLEPN|nr:Uncharacterised protein [Klebsiella pneumoniae]